LAKQSYLQHPINTIYNGVDLNVFKPNNESILLRDKHQLNNRFVILGVASIWDKRKGLDDFISLSKIVDYNEIQLILIGLSKDQIKKLPNIIIGIERTENVQQLADYYSLADVFVNPTWQDNFPTTNIESLACGTPVITYNTGGSPEALDEHIGFVVDKGDVNGIVKSIEKLRGLNYEDISKACRTRAERLYDKKIRYLDYLRVFEEMVEG
jgi:glycosyltransferase involved in cell wall biosynthesis